MLTPRLLQAPTPMWQGQITGPKDGGREYRRIEETCQRVWRTLVRCAICRGEFPLSGFRFPVGEPKIPSWIFMIRSVAVHTSCAIP